MSKKLLSFLMVSALFSTTNTANATLYNFNQQGFDDGASISGSFQVHDLNANGLIEGSMSYCQIWCMA